MSKQIRIAEAMREAKASLEIEGIAVTESDEELVRMRLNGDITEEEFLRRAIERAENA